MTRDRVRMARIALAYLVEPGNRDLALLVDECGPVDALDRAVRGDVTRIPAGHRARAGWTGATRTTSPLTCSPVRSGSARAS